MKFISLNIEGDTHLGRILPFLKKENPDLICMQDIFKSDALMISEKFGLKLVFAANVSLENPLRSDLKSTGPFGIAMFSKLQFKNWRTEYYFREKTEHGELPVRKFAGANIGHKLALIAEVEESGCAFKIITTHFTWSNKGMVTEMQKQDMSKLISILEHEGEIIFCGDLNTPRGDSLWAELAARYKDNIPREISTTIDNEIHRDSTKENGIFLVVDSLFSSPAYEITGVNVVNGVSDHCAITCNIRSAIPSR